VGLVYAVANQKGGVGKTTTTVNLAAGFARASRRVLVVDLDQQANATVALGLSKEDRPSTYDVLAGRSSLESAARKTAREGLLVVPGSRDLAGATVELPRLDDPNSQLSRVTGSVREDFDAVFLDCPPALGPVTVNALVAADRVIVPVQAEYLALEGLVEFLGTLSVIRREMNPSLELAGVVVTMHDERTRLAQDVERELRDHFSETVFRTVIPRTVRIAEAPSYGVSVFDYAPDSRGARAFEALTGEVADRG